MRRFLIAAAMAGLALSACDSPREPTAPSPSAPAFAHSAEGDLSGYYMPLGEVRVGDWALSHLFVGQAADFSAWDDGRRSATFAPVMLQFDDLSSPMVQTEIGEARSVTARVLPSAYTVSDSQVRFEGRSAELGPVRFEGRLDPGALATARRNLGDEGVVVSGDLTVGGRVVRGVRLRWWAGD